MPSKAIPTCALCTTPWKGPGSPATCPVCGLSSFAIVRESFIGLDLGDEKCPTCVHAGGGSPEPLCWNCEGENYGRVTEITSTNGCSNWKPKNLTPVLEVSSGPTN